MRMLRILFTVLILACSSVAFAQFPVVTNPTATPIPGAGHDYLNGPADSVNPSSGSVSIRIPVIMPPGRGITLPFSFAYDSGGANYLGGNCTNGHLVWLTTGTGCGTEPNFSIGGWSETVPAITHQQLDWTTQAQLNAPTKKGKASPRFSPGTFQCHAVMGFVYQDAQGGRHNLGLTTWNDPNGTGWCTFNNQDWPPGFDGEVVTQGDVTRGADGSILSTLTGDWQFPIETITNADGSGFTTSGNGMNPGSVLDRYGNVVGIAGTFPALQYTDTTGRTALQSSGFAVNPETVAVSGLGAPYTVNWTTLATPTFTTPITILPQTLPFISDCPNPVPHGGWGIPGVSSITLPNGNSFTFTYDTTYGLVNKMTYPTGGYVRYAWGINLQAEEGHSTDPSNGQTQGECDMYYGVPAVIDRYVSFDGVTEVLHQHFSYSTNWPSGSATWTTKQTTVSTYDLVRGTSFQTVYNYTPSVGSYQPNMWSGPLPQIAVESSVSYYNDLGTTLLKTVSKTWTNQRLLASQTTALPNNQVSKTVWSYNSNEMQTEQDDYDFGTGAPGSFMRATVTNYQSFGSNHIVDHPSSVVVYSDANKTVKAAETDYTYDSPAGTATSGIVQHSGGCNCGSLTQSSQWLNSGGTTLSTTYTNDDTGQRLTMTGPRGAGHTTNYSYTDHYSSGNPPGPTNAYLTQITNALNQTQKFTYAYTSGEVTSATDPNSQVTGYQYNDPGNFARLTETDFPTPDGGVTTIAYTDTPGAIRVETKHKIDSSRWTDNIVLYNGMGMPVAGSTANDEATPWDRTDTCYDGNSRALFSSYPYQVSSATAAPNCSGTGDTMTYDGLGRATQVSHSDGSTVLTSYTGGATQVQDEGNGNSTSRVTRVSQVDGLGRLLSVCEVTFYAVQGTGGSPAACGQDIAATGFLTSYSYNTLGDLLSVSQGALNQRSFSYDFASRLQTANNPESGTITYVYDTNPGSCPSVTYPFTGILASKLDARSVRTCYQYDGLDRVTQKNYSDGTPTASFNFDQSSAYGVGLSYPIGHLTSQSTASPNPTGEIFSYDQLGRVKINSQCTPQNCSANTVFPVTYTYDLLGDTTSRKEGAGRFGRTLTYVVNIAARLTSLSSSLNDSTHPGLLFSAAHYNSAGSLLSASLGCVPTSCTINETRTYDARLRLASISDGSNYALTIPSSGGYAPDSDILAANDSVNGNWNYWYDDFNRLLGSSTNGSILNFDYDRFGNRWHQFQNDNCYAGQCFSFTGNNNRMDGYFYDASGNLLNDGTHNYYYDAESRMIQVDGPTLGACSTATACYVYNASGERVRKTTGGASVDYLRDLAGHEITELSSSGAWNRGEVYAGNRHVATYELGTTYLNFSDWLGTERLRTLATGVTCETITSLPFGDNQLTSGSCADSSPMHFTGKQRDSESNLDSFEARDYSNQMGRFMSVDPHGAGALEQDPQTWNMYSYVRNNPLRYTDPDGRDYNVCINQEDGSQNCTSYRHKSDFLNALNGTGATLNGDDKKGQIVVSVNGQSVVTGTYTKVPGMGNEGGGLQYDDIIAPGLAGGLAGGIRAGIRGIAGGLFEGGASSAVEETTTVVAQQIVSGATKQGLRDALESSGLSDAAKVAVKSALRRGGVGDKYTLEQLADGSVKIIREVAGRAGGRATYEQMIDGATGLTKSVIQKAYDAAGNLVHVHPKFP